jgi:hypothetical protein
MIIKAHPHEELRGCKTHVEKRSRGIIFRRLDLLQGAESWMPAALGRERSSQLQGILKLSGGGGGSRNRKARTYTEGEREREQRQRQRQRERPLRVHRLSLLLRNYERTDREVVRRK